MECPLSLDIMGSITVNNAKVILVVRKDSIYSYEQKWKGIYKRKQLSPSTKSASAHKALGSIISKDTCS